MPRMSKVRAAALKHGWRSGLEEQIARQLRASKVAFKYEQVRVPYTPETRTAHYTPDFLLPNGIIVETKGRFVTADRKKHLAVKEQHPNLDIRFVFSNPRAKIGKKSKTTYAAWCEKHGFEYAALAIPGEWLTLAVNKPALSAALALLTTKRST